MKRKNILKKILLACVCTVSIGVLMFAGCSSSDSSNASSAFSTVFPSQISSDAS